MRHALLDLLRARRDAHPDHVLLQRLLGDLCAGREPQLSDRELAAMAEEDAEALDELLEEVGRGAVDPMEDPDLAAHSDWYGHGECPYDRGPQPVERCEFLLGTHHPHWIWNGRARGPLFVSARRLTRRISDFPEGLTAFCIDSGGFTELRLYGDWQTSREEYIDLVRRCDLQVGTLEWASIQDWMVEPDALDATGMSLVDHQELTTLSFLELVECAPELRWLPVLQGQTLDDYLAHIELYRREGIHLQSVERVGLGSVCRRQATQEVAEIVAELSARGLRLHAFGLKMKGLDHCAPDLASSDSLAWSFGARRRAPGMQNNQDYAENWRDEVLSRIAAASRHPIQLSLPQ